jgi:hypothetical protein
VNVRCDQIDPVQHSLLRAIELQAHAQRLLNMDGLDGLTDATFERAVSVRRRCATAARHKSSCWLRRRL